MSLKLLKTINLGQILLKFAKQLLASNLKIAKQLEG